MYDLAPNTNLLVYYNFNEGYNEGILDHSGNNFHGDLLGNASRDLHKGKDLMEK
jgi:hypothetical protein